MNYKQNVLVILLVVSGLTPFLARAELDFPTSFRVYSQDGFSVMQGDCQSKGSSTIDCKIIQILFSLKTEEEAESELQEGLKALNSAKQTDLKKSLDVCATFSQKLEKAQSEVEPRKRPNVEMESRGVVEMCKCAKLEKTELVGCLKGWMTADVRSRVSECKMAMINDFNLTFSKVGNKWISNPGPKGICDVVNVATIEKHESNSWLLVKFTQVRVSKSDGKLCEALEVNKPAIYSWKFSTGTSFMPCKGLKI